MRRSELNRQVARATGESLACISSRGFSLVQAPRRLSTEEREPLLVDWEGLDATRRSPFPSPTRRG
jgi:hypothetical protein